eukprot:GHVT01085764.1.p1 GENE.GHVT01085764.1~~GHVT01085764.1.p1  ORF type:complete len:167 (+),score=28.58 GHVT01085764.1:670-1170(+)
MHHISAGECLIEERETPGSEYGEMITNCIKDGLIVPVEVTVMLLRKKMEALGWEDGRFMIDGFPRNQNNLDGWLKAMGDSVEISYCIVFECTEDEMTRRLLERAKTSGRIDDNMESIRKRFRIFQEQTLPIIEYFDKLGKCRRIDALGGVEEVWAKVKLLLEDVPK